VAHAINSVLFDPQIHVDQVLAKSNAARTSVAKGTNHTKKEGVSGGAQRIAEDSGPQLLRVTRTCQA
jgi:hypothetical protein